MLSTRAVNHCILAVTILCFWIYCYLLLFRFVKIEFSEIRLRSDVRVEVSRKSSETDHGEHIKEHVKEHEIRLAQQEGTPTRTSTTPPHSTGQDEHAADTSKTKTNQDEQAADTSKTKRNQDEQAADTSKTKRNQDEHAADTSKRNFLFLKTHKCGTSSLVNSCYLYGVRRRFNFVSAPFKRQLNLSQDILPARPKQLYNIQCAHTVYDPVIEHRLLPTRTTFYTTIVRSPGNRFKSAFSFFGADRAIVRNNPNISYDESINMYLRSEVAMKPTNETVYLSHYINSLARDLGFGKYLKRPGLLKNKIADFISDLERDFDFVMLTDYFDMSLILLRDSMGLKNSDLFYINRMGGYSTRKSDAIRPETEQLIRDYNIVDVEIYDFFFDIFQRKVQMFGQDLLEKEVLKFRKERAEFGDMCFDKSHNPSNIHAWVLTEYGESEPSCSFLRLADIKMIQIISQLQVTDDMQAADYEELLNTYKKQPIEMETMNLVKQIQQRASPNQFN